ncbi:MAG: RES family NAD+ phosphorylase [Nitrospirales bacterium]
MKISTDQFHWKPCYRIIPSRFLPIQLFERVADSDDLDAVMAVESLTNDRLRDETGEVQLVPSGDRVTGSGASIIMAAFTHLNPAGSRFSDGSYGVFYTAHDLNTAINETRYHRERFMRATRQGRMELDMRVYTLTLKSQLHDIRGLHKKLGPVYDADDYSAGQQLGKSLRSEGAWGIVYHSVRHKGGECAGVFHPSALSHCKQGQHLCYVWDGERINHIYKKRAYL